MGLKKQTLWSLAPLIITTFINLFSVPLFLKYLGPEMYALWLYVLTFTGAFGFMDLGLGVAMGRYIGIALAKEDQAAVRGYWATGHAFTSVLLVFMAVGFMAVGFFFGPYWFNIRPENISTLRLCFIAGGVGLFLSYYSQLWTILAQAHLDFIFLARLRIAGTILSVFPSLYLAKITGNPFLILSWTAVAILFQVGWLILHSRQTYQLRFHFNLFEWKRIKEMFLFTTKIFLDLLLGAFFGTMDRLILGKLATPAQFTEYGIATNVGSRLTGLSVSVMGPVFHNTSRAVGKNSHAEAAHVYNSIFDFVFGWFFLASVWAFIWGRPALMLWLGPSMGSQVAIIFGPLITAYALISMSNIAGAQLGPLDRVGTGLIIRIFTTLLTIITVWFGWKWHGLPGAAWGFLLSRCGCLVQDVYVIRLIRGGGWLSLVTWKHMFFQMTVACFWILIKFLYPFSIFSLFILSLFHGGSVAFILVRQSLPSRRA